jgi:hypothetical protein
MMSIDLIPATNHVSLGADGTLALPVATPPGLQFRFRFFGRSFAALTRSTAQGIELELAACLAPLPYTAEGSALRRAASAIVADSQLNRGFRFAVSRKQQIFLLASMKIAAPMRPADLVSAIVVLLASARPHLETLRDSLPSWGAVTR